MVKKITLSVIIPAYNEEDIIKKTLTTIEKYLVSQGYFYEIIVIDDGSKDRTSDIARSLKIKNLTVITNKENRGKGYVVRQGLLRAKGDYRLFIDADGSTSIRETDKIWSFFEKGCGMVIGSRNIEGAVIVVPQTPLRRLLGKIFNLIARGFCGLWRFKDTQCGFKCFSQRAVESILSKATVNGWAFDVELLAIAKLNGQKVCEIPVRWNNNLKSKVNFRGMVKMIFEVLKIRINLIKRVYE